MAVAVLGLVLGLQVVLVLVLVLVVLLLLLRLLLGWVLLLVAWVRLLGLPVHVWRAVHWHVCADVPRAGEHCR